MPIPRKRISYTPYDEIFSPEDLSQLEEQVTSAISRLAPNVHIKTGIIEGKLRLGVSMPGVRHFQRGVRTLDELTFDLVPGPVTPTGQTLGIYYQTGSTRLFGTEITGTPQAPQISGPYETFARYIAGAFETRNEQRWGDVKNRFERLSEMSSLLPENMRVAGALQMYSTFHSPMARAGMASRITIGTQIGGTQEEWMTSIADRVRMASRIPIAERTPEEALWGSLGTYVPMKEDTGAIRLYNLGVETAEGQVALLGKEQKWFKHYNVASIPYGTQREQAGLYQVLTGPSNAFTGLQQVMPEYITKKGYENRVGLRYSNLLGPTGERIPGVVAPNVAFGVGLYSGSSLMYRDIFSRPGELATATGGITSRDVIQLPFEEQISALRTAKFEFGVMRPVSDPETGKIINYEKVRELQGTVIRPGEEMVIGKYTYTGEGGRPITEPLKISAGSGPLYLDPSTIRLLMPREREAMLDWGTSGLRTQDLFERRMADPKVREAINEQYQTTIDIMREVQAGNPNLPISMSTAGQVGLFVGGVMGTGTSLKGLGVKTVISEPTRLLDESIARLAQVGGTSVELTGISDSIKNYLEHFKWSAFGFADPTTQMRMMATFGGQTARQMITYARGVQRKSPAGTPGALDPERLGQIYAQTQGLEYIPGFSQYQMFEKMRSNILAMPPEKAWGSFGYALQRQAYPFKNLNIIEESERQILRQGFIEAAEMRAGVSLRTPEGRASFREQFGVSAAQLLRETLPFTRIEGQRGLWRENVTSPFLLSQMVGWATPEFMAAPGGGIGYEVARAFHTLNPAAARQLGLDPRMSFAEQSATNAVSVPPHQRGWRDVYDVTRYNLEGTTRTAEPAVRTVLTPDKMREIRDILFTRPDMPLKEMDVLFGGQGPLYNPTTKTYLPRPQSIEDITKYRYEDETLQSVVTGATFDYMKAVPDFLEGGGVNLSRWQAESQRLVEAKEIPKLLQKRFVTGLVGGRYGAVSGVSLFTGVMDEGLMRGALRRKGEAAGLRGEELNRWLGITMEQAGRQGGLPMMGLREPDLGALSGLSLMVTTPEILRKQGLGVPRGTEIRGGSLRLGSMAATGYMGSMSAIMAAVGGDWDADLMFQLIMGKVDPNKGLVYPEGVPSVMAPGAQVRAHQAINQWLYGSHREWDPVVNAMKDLQEGAARLEGGTGLSVLPREQLTREAGQYLIARGGMGASYNARRLMEAAATAIGISPQQINVGQTAATETYQPYLDKILKQISERGGLSNLETILNSAIFGKSGSEVALLAKPSAQVRHTKLWSSAQPEDFTSAVSGRLAQAIEGDKLSPALSAFLFSSPGVPIGALAEKIEKQGLGSTIRGLSMAPSIEEFFGLPVEGRGTTYDIQKTPIGLGVITSAAGRLSGWYGRTPSRTQLDTGEWVDTSSQVSTHTFPIGRTKSAPLYQFNPLSGKSEVSRPAQDLAGTYVPLGLLAGTEDILATEALYGFMSRQQGGRITPYQQLVLQRKALGMQGERNINPDLLAYTLSTLSPIAGELPPGATSVESSATRPLPQQYTPPTVRQRTGEAAVSGATVTLGREGAGGGAGGGGGGGIVIPPGEGDEDFIPFYGVTRGGRRTRRPVSLMSTKTLRGQPWFGFGGGGEGAGEGGVFDVYYHFTGPGSSERAKESKMVAGYGVMAGMGAEDAAAGGWSSRLLTQIESASGMSINRDTLEGLPEAVARITTNPQLTRQVFGPQRAMIERMAQGNVKVVQGSQVASREDFPNFPAGIIAELKNYGTMQGSPEVVAASRAGYLGSVLKATLQGSDIWSEKEFRPQAITQTFQELKKAVDEAIPTIKKWREELDRAAEPEERAAIEAKISAKIAQVGKLPGLKAYDVALSQEIARISAEGVEGDQDRLASLLEQQGITATQISSIERGISRAYGRVPAGQQVSGAVRRLIGGWGLFYLGHLAGFPQRAWEYGMAEGEQYNAQLGAYAGAIGGGGIGGGAYAQTQYQVAQARILAGGLPGAYLQAAGAMTPGGIRDIGGAAMAGAAGYAGALYIGSAIRDVAPLGNLLIRAAPLIGLVGIAGGLALNQAAYARFPQQTIARMVGDLAVSNQNRGLAGDIAAFSYFYQAGGRDVARENQAEATYAGLANWLGGYQAQITPITGRTGFQIPGFVGGQRQFGQARALTPDEQFTWALALQGMPGLQGLDPNILGQTGLRWLRAGVAGPGMEARLRRTVEAQMMGIQIPELAVATQQALRMPPTTNVAFEQALTQALPTIYTQGAYQTGLNIVGGMPSYQAQMYVPQVGRAEDQIAQIMNLRQFTRSGMDIFLQQQTGLMQQEFMWGIPSSQGAIPTVAGPGVRRNLAISQARVGSIDQSLARWFTVGGGSLGIVAQIQQQMAANLYRGAFPGAPTGIQRPFMPTAQQVTQLNRLVGLGETTFGMGLDQAVMERASQTPWGTQQYMTGLSNWQQAGMLGLNQNLFLGGFSNFQQGVLGSMALDIGARMATAGVSPAQMNPIVGQMMQNYGSASFIQGLFGGNPINVTMAAAAGTPGYSQYATMDIGTAGPTGGPSGYGLTGLPLFTTSMWQGNIPPQQVATRIWGSGWQSSPAARAGVYGYNIQAGRQATPAEMRAGGAGIAGGIWGMQAYMNDLSYAAQAAQAGIQLQQLRLSYAFQTGIGLDAYGTVDPRTGRKFDIQGTGGFWGIEDRQRDLAARQARWGFQMQERQLQMQTTQFYENMGLNRQQQLLQRSWTQADWSFQDQSRALQRQWRLEDWQEQLPFMGGRERRVAERQMRREGIMFTMEGEQIDTQRGRQKEIWKLEDERNRLTIKQFEEQKKLQEESLKKQRDFYEEGKKLQDKATELQRAYFIENQKLQEAAIGAQLGYAAAMHDAQEKMILLQQEQTRVEGGHRLIVSLEAQWVNTVVAGLNHLITNAHDLWDKIKEGKTIPGFTAPSGGGGGSSSDDDDNKVYCCFDGEAKVTMADGSLCAIKNVNIGDKVKNGSGGISIVAGIRKPELGKRKMYAFNNNYAFASEEHPFLTSQGWGTFEPDSPYADKSMGELVRIDLGTILKTDHGDEVVTEIWGVPEYENKIIYDLSLDQEHTYFVEGYLVHNKKPCPTATGGPIMAGRGALVGEAGPEKIKARLPISVIPANELMAMFLGGQTLKDPWENIFVPMTPPGGGVRGQPTQIVIQIGDEVVATYFLDKLKKNLKV